MRQRAAAVAAHMGMRPVAEMQFIDFISCAYDMLTNYVATARYRAGLATPIVVRGPCGGYVRGGPFHSQNPEAAFLHTPGLKIVYPATARDAKGLIKASIRDDDPVIYLEHKWLYRRIKEPLPEGERSEEHTSELQSPCNLVCRLLLEKKNQRGRVHGRPRRTTKWR